jgi:hypothetical protein
LAYGRSSDVIVCGSIAKDLAALSRNCGDGEAKNSATLSP